MMLGTALRDFARTEERRAVPGRWRVLYPDDAYCVGQRGVLWQEKLSHVNLAPVWDVLSALNKDGRFGFFIALAKHSRANVYKL
jgi:hypothetical protein